jgi:hypothetical protein
MESFCVGVFSQPLLYSGQVLHDHEESQTCVTVDLIQTKTKWIQSLVNNSAIGLITSAGRAGYFEYPVAHHEHLWADHREPLVAVTLVVLLHLLKDFPGVL